MLLATFCRPKPRPTPSAPLNTVSIEKSMPRLLSGMNTARMTNASRMVLESSSLADVVRLSSRRMRDSNKEENQRDTLTVTKSTPMASMTEKRLILVLPILKAMESSRSTRGAYKSTMCSRAMAQMMIASDWAKSWLRMRRRTIREKVQAAIARHASRSRMVLYCLPPNRITASSIRAKARACGRQSTTARNARARCLS